MNSVLYSLVCQIVLFDLVYTDSQQMSNDLTLESVALFNVE